MEQRVDRLITRTDGKALVLLNCCPECQAEFEDQDLPLCDECSLRVESLVRLMHSRPLFAIEFEEGSYD